MSKRNTLNFGSGSLYKLEIQGKVSDSWNDQFGPLKITQEVENKNVYKSTLVFRTKDQAELMNVLNIIYQMHLPILSLVRLHEKKKI
jgi:hypothetical protein